MTTTSLATAPTIVRAIEGTASVRRADGKVEPLKVGDVIYPGDQVLAAAGSSVEVRAEALAETRPTDAVAAAWNAAPAVRGVPAGGDALDAVLKAIDQQDPQAVPAAGGADGSLEEGLRVERVVEGVGEGSVAARLPSEPPRALPEFPTEPTQSAPAATPAAPTPGAVPAPPPSGAAPAPAPVPAPAPAPAPPNQRPVGNAAPVDGVEDRAVTVNLSGSDADGTVQAVTVTSVPAGAQLFLADGTTAVSPGQVLTPAQAGSLVLVPALHFNGTVQIGYTVTDNAGSTSAPGTVPVTIAPMQDAPVARADAASTTEDRAVAGNVISGSGAAGGTAGAGADTDADGDVLRITGVSAGSSNASNTPPGTVGQPLAGQFGSLLLQPDGGYLYTPGAAAQALPAGTEATDTFTYTVSDGAGSSAQATLTIRLTGVDDGSVITGTSTGTVTEDATTTATGRLVATDVDAAGGTGAFVPATRAGSLGTLTIGADGRWTYTLNNADPAVQALADGDVRVERFQVVTTDGTAQTLTIDVRGSNDAPTVSSTSASGTEDAAGPVAVTLRGSDIDGSVAGYTVARLPVNGTLFLDAAGTQPVAAGTLLPPAPGGSALTLYFRPAADWSGNTDFTYTATDDRGAASASATVAINVAAVNDAPVAQADVASTPINTPLASIQVLVNDSDADGDVLRIASASVDPALGSVSVNADGTLAFTPATNVTGPVTLSYVVGDGRGGSASASVVVNVGSNTPPTGTDATIVLNEDSSVTLRPVDFGFADADAGQVLAGVRIDSLPAGGALTLNGAAVSAGQLVPVAALAAGQLVFTPTPNGNGNSGLGFSVQDSSGAFDLAPNTLTLAIAPIADAPVNTVPGAQASSEDAALVFSAANGNAISVADADGGTLTTTLAVGQGRLTLSPTALATAGITVVGNGTGSVQITGSAAAINAALEGATFTGTADRHGSSTLTVTTSDGTTTDTDTIALTQSAVADIANDTATVDEDGSVAIAVLANDSFENAGRVISAVDGQAISAGGPAVAVANGSVTLNAGGQLVFAPVANYNGPASFTYTVSSGGVTETANVDVTVTPVNDGPVTRAPGAQTTDEDAPLVFSTANGNAITVADVDGGTLTTTVAVTNGSLALGSTALATPGVAVVGNGTGSVQITGTAAAINAALNGTTFIGTADRHGSATLTVTTNDGLASDVASVALTIAAVTDIASDSATVDEDGSVAIAVLSNDTFEGAGRVISAVDGQPITAGGSAVAVANGTVTLNASGQLVFAPTADYNGPASFTYTVTSGGVTETATVNITVAPVNDGPVNRTPGAQSAAEDAPLVFSAANGNSITVADVDAGSLTTTVAVTHGTLTLGSTAGVTVVGNGTGSVQITGNAAAINAALNGTAFNGTADRHGSATVTVTTSDGAATDIDTVALTITAINDIVNDSATVAEDGSVTLAVLSNDSFENTGRVISAVDGQSIAAGGPAVAVANGTVLLNASGQLVFAPSADYNGPAGFTYTVASGGVTETATVSVNVTAVNDGPVARADVGSTNEDAALVVSAANGVLQSAAAASGRDSDVEGDALTVSAVSFGATAGAVGTALAGAWGSLTINADGSYRYAPGAAAQGLDSGESQAEVFTYTVSDGRGGSASTTLTITVTGSNDAPQVAADVGSTPEDTPVSGNLLANDRDVDGEPLAVTTFSVAGVAGTFNAGQTATITGVGTLAIAADGAFTFTPAGNYHGPVPVATYVVSDGSASASGTLTLGVTPVNDAPVAVADRMTTLEDTPVSGNVLGNDSDVDSANLSVTQFSVAGVASSFSAGQSAVIAGVGTFTLAASGAYTFTPAAHHSGAVPAVTYTVSDGNGGAATAALNITITPVADAPTLRVATSGAALVSANSWESAANSDLTSEQLNSRTFEGWTRVDGPDVYAGGINGTEVWTVGDQQQRADGDYNLVTASAGNGDNFVELNNAGSLVQTLALERQVSTVDGMVYQLSLDYAGRPGFTADYTRIGVYLDGVLIQQFAATSPMTHADWHNLKFAFEGDGNTHTLSIRTDATQFNTAGRGAFIDDAEIVAVQGVMAGNAAGGTRTSVGLAGYVSAALIDGDGSESLTLTFSGVPAGAVIVTGSNPAGHVASGGSITISGSELASAQLQFASSVSGHLSVGVRATSTESANPSSTASTSATLELDVLPVFASTNLSGDGLVNIIGTTGSETLNGGNAAEYLVGRAGNDALNGGDGNDVLDGGTGTDNLAGGRGNDVLYGGAGNDQLSGGAGADVFRWTLADRGAPGAPANDTISDFTNGPGGDSLNLADLLVAENAGNLDDYLHFSTVGNSTVVQISATGGFAAGFNAGAIDQTITLQGVDLSAAGTQNTQQIINQLLTNGSLTVGG
ncbi:MAG: hypothetical protein AD742_15315 [Methylibium sp. NZG]|nr:MAG: hypothetical protein AD742_15315 [Methylibium sp. NZG]